LDTEWFVIELSGAVPARRHHHSVPALLFGSALAALGQGSVDTERPVHGALSVGAGLAPGRSPGAGGQEAGEGRGRPIASGRSSHCFNLAFSQVVNPPCRVGSGIRSRAIGAGGGGGGGPHMAATDRGRRTYHSGPLKLRVRLRSGCDNHCYIGLSGMGTTGAERKRRGRPTRPDIFWMEDFWRCDKFRIRAVQHYAPVLRIDGPGHKSEEFPIRFEERNSHEV
jgi:hypothetical protein